MIFSIEMKSIHDLVMLDTLIDAWKAKWKADDEELKHEDAEDEQCDCDDEPEAETDDEPDAEAHKQALEKLAKCLHDSGIADVSFTYCGTARNHMKK